MSAAQKAAQKAFNDTKALMRTKGVNFAQDVRPPNYPGQNKKPCFCGLVFHATGHKCSRKNHYGFCCDINKTPTELKTVDGIIKAALRVKSGAGTWF